MLVLTSLILLAGCGGNGTDEFSRYAGEWSHLGETREMHLLIASDGTAMGSARLTEDGPTILFHGTMTPKGLLSGSCGASGTLSETFTATCRTQTDGTLWFVGTLRSDGHAYPADFVMLPEGRSLP